VSCGLELLACTITTGRPTVVGNILTTRPVEIEPRFDQTKSSSTTEAQVATGGDFSVILYV